MKDDIWKFTSIDAAGGTLTQEMIEEAAIKAMENCGSHPCSEGHLVNSHQMAKGEGFCLRCAQYLVLTKK